MITPNSWRGLLEQAVAHTHINTMPKKPKAEDWFMLRERWNKYPDSQKEYYLATALGRYLLGSARQSQTVDPEVVKRFQTSLRLEEFNDTDKRMIAAAIMDAERYSYVDNALISEQKALKKRVNQPD